MSIQSKELYNNNGRIQRHYFFSKHMTLVGQTLKKKI